MLSPKPCMAYLAFGMSDVRAEFRPSWDTRYLISAPDALRRPDFVDVQRGRPLTG
jgi:hypothetical protein